MTYSIFYAALYYVTLITCHIATASIFILVVLLIKVVYTAVIIEIELIAV